MTAPTRQLLERIRVAVARIAGARLGGPVSRIPRTGRSAYAPSASTCPVGPLSFRRIVDIPFHACVAALANEQPAGQHGEPAIGHSLLLGPVDHDPGSLHWTRTLHLDLVFLEKKYYAALRNFFQVVRTADEGKIVLQPASATVN